ncbi:NADPH-dependent FMN reductase [Kribbella sp. ALI-6-A]|uniref:NADPH-dependent FMN reductase n=1 Tax=Kribbella sp. ALI-6-A TaxID=1933817 RepID=UPI00097C3A6A|nr:NADPH-dependent FMN reductase [Kribbella sp. ALI-6-A]ONI78522.1 NADPH-dependent FMN reductase [Kribbella sp. ALI-6-A]
MTHHLQIVIGSTRPGRVGPAVAHWFARTAREHGGFDIELVDLADLDLPLLDEPNHPRLQEYRNAHTKMWSDTVQRADAFVFVHPEYNFGVNAALKNALDYLVHEWRDKTVGLVSYGGVSGGLRAAQMLKQSFSALGLFAVPAAVTVPFVAEHLNVLGEFEPTPIMQDSAQLMLDELVRLTGALAPLRA